MLYSKSGIGWRAAFFPMLPVPNLGAFVPAHAPSRMGRLEDIPALRALFLRSFRGRGVYRRWTCLTCRFLAHSALQLILLGCLVEKIFPHWTHSLSASSREYGARLDLVSWICLSRAHPALHVTRRVLDVIVFPHWTHAGFASFLCSRSYITLLRALPWAVLHSLLQFICRWCSGTNSLPHWTHSFLTCRRPARVFSSRLVSSSLRAYSMPSASVMVLGWTAASISAHRSRSVSSSFRLASASCHLRMFESRFARAHFLLQLFLLGFVEVNFFPQVAHVCSASNLCPLVCNARLARAHFWPHSALSLLDGSNSVPHWMHSLNILYGRGVCNKNKSARRLH